MVTTMIDNYDNVPENSKEKAEEIYNEIIRMLDAENNEKILFKKSVLSAKLKSLIALGSALASQQSQNVVFCVKESMKTGATQKKIMEVLRVAILIAEIPVQKYTEIVQAAFQSFEDHPWQ